MGDADQVDVVMGEEGDEPEIELNDDSETYERLNMARVPIIISISQVQCVLVQALRVLDLVVGVHVEQAHGSACRAGMQHAQPSNLQWQSFCMPWGRACMALHALLTKLPQTINQVGNRCVVDLSCEEEPCARSTLHVAAGPNGRVCGVTKDGQHGVNTSLMQVRGALKQLFVVELRVGHDSHTIPCAVARHRRC